MTDTLPPPGLSVALHRSTRVFDGGRVLVGGSRARVMRVSEEGRRTVAGWRSPAAVGEPLARRHLARTLLDAGILSPHPQPAARNTALTVVVPVRDRPEPLARCLDAVVAGCPGVRVLVVDDGSADPAPVREVAARHAHVDVIRFHVSRGPAAARNAGLAACSTPFVAYVDSDVVVPEGWAAPLLGHFADPRVAAVAPRILAMPGARGLIAGYEKRHSALDMGATAGPVAPATTLPYVPSTVLVVRRAAMSEGFDESLPIGEDVDLVWRLVRDGWRVYYEAAVHAWHDHRVRLPTFAARRRLYARSTAMLARRHPDAVTAMWFSPWLVAPWVLAAAGRPRAALVAAVAAGARVRHGLGRLARPRLIALLLVRGLVATGDGLGHAVRRAWAPPLALLAIRHRVPRRVLIAAYAAPVLRDAFGTRRVSAALADAPVRVLDEAIALSGVWEGCLQERTARPLLPSWRAGRIRR